MNTISSQVGKFEIVLYDGCERPRVAIFCKGEEVSSYNCSEENGYLRYATISNFLLDVERCVKEDPTVFEWIGHIARKE